MRRARQTEAGYANQSAVRKPRFEPVMCPKPVFESVNEKVTFEHAVEAYPRLPGETLPDWMARVSREAAAGMPRAPEQLNLPGQGGA